MNLIGAERNVCNDTKMDPGMERAAEFLSCVKAAVTRLDDFAYLMVLRFYAVNRRYAEARMLNGGYFCITCSFAPLDSTKTRSFIWAIHIDWTADEWTVRAIAEVDDEADDGPKPYWESAPFHAATFEDFARCLSSAQESIEGTLALPWVLEIFEKLKAEWDAQMKLASPPDRAEPS